ncbi:MAG: hypothetical protein Q8P67_03785, partial [archaeon]|nr:hypothetical protein [archaeon]
MKTQPWALATTAAEAEKAAEELRKKHKTEEFVVKAQIHAGGRGVGRFTNGFKGGVHLTRETKKVGELAGSMLGQSLITKQTPPEGVPVSKLMIAHALDFNLEYYLSFVMDRSYPSGPVLVFCPDGGVDIESVAEHSPELIQKIPIDINKGLSLEEAKRLAYGFGFHDWVEAGEQLKNIYELFVKTDCTQLEINPWVQTKDQQVYVVKKKKNEAERKKSLPLFFFLVV